MSELGDENAAGGGPREGGSSRILMRGPGSPCDPGSPCLAAGSGQIPPGISIHTDSVWIEIRVEFAQGPFLAGLPSGSAFLLSCRGALPLPLWQTRDGLARERLQIVCVTREIRTLRWIPKAVSILGTYFHT